MSGKITLFMQPGCSNCEKIRQLLATAGASSLNEINVVEKPDWNPLLFLLTGGSSEVPQVFFNSSYVGGLSEVEHLAKQGGLVGVVKDCLSDSDPAPFPPELRTPDPAEYFELVPTRQREEWQSYMEELCSTLSPLDKPVELVVMMMDTPVNNMVIVCSAGAASAQFKVGGVGSDKKPEGSEEQLYCQMVMKEKKTFFFNDPANLPADLRNNVDLVKYGYGYYIGSPWSVGEIRGMIVALEKQAGILKEDHVPIIEKLRDKIEKEWMGFLYIKF